MFVLVRAVTYASLFIGLLFVFLPGEVIRRAGVAPPAATGPAQIAGAALVVLGGALAVWCILAFAHLGRGTPAPFDPPRRLVVRGPYRFVRNPMYVGAGLLLFGVALYYRSLALAGYAAAFLAMIHLFVVAYEEPTLRRTFGEDYAAYCRDVRRWWPGRARGRATGA